MNRTLLAGEPPRPRETGVTLIELMVSIALVGILLAIGVPSFRAFIENSRVSSALSALESSLKLARTEAVERNSEVQVCRRLNDTSCEDGSTWEGLLVIDVDSGERIRVQSDFGSGVEYQSAPASGVTFDGSGMADAAVSFQLMLDGECERVVDVSATGIVSRDDCP